MDVMIDIETLGTKPGCVVLSIGAVAFDPYAKYDPGFVYPDSQIFYRNFTIFDQLIAGLIIEKKTINWWKDQSSEAKQAVMPNKVYLRSGLNELITWLNSLKENRNKIWANSPDFDLSIIEAAAKAVKIEMLPWTFRDKADLRTIKYVTELVTKPPLSMSPPVRTGVHHNALDDCFYQVASVQYCMNGLTNG